MIQDDGIVSTGAGTHSPHPLQVTAKSQKRAGGSPNMEPSIGEQKAKCPARHPKCFQDLAGGHQCPVCNYLRSHEFCHLGRRLKIHKLSFSTREIDLTSSINRIAQH